MARQKTEINGRRSKGDGGVTYIKARDVWCAQLDIGVDEETGKRIRKSFVAKTKQEALSKKKEFLLSGEQEEISKPKKKTNKTQAVQGGHPLGQYTIEYLTVFKKSSVKDRTFAWYRDLSKHIIEGLGDKTVESLTAVDIQQFLNGLAEEKSEKTIKGIQSILHQVIKHAVLQGVILSDPFNQGVKRPKAKKTTQKSGKALPEHICREVMEAIEKSPTYKPMITVLMHTGIRVGELMALRWSNIDKENMLLHIEDAVTKQFEFDEKTLETVSRKSVVGDTKTQASQRVVPIDLAVLEVLDEWREKSIRLQEKAHKNGNDGLIFPNRYGAVRSYDGFRRQFQRFLAQSGIDAVSFHKFRHTFATFLMEEGANPRVVQELLGHKDIETTLSIYTSVSTGVMEKEVSKLSERLCGIRDNATEPDVRHRLIVTG